jgi:hypothetical protein
MSNDHEKKNYYFSVICFSTDQATYKPMDVVKQYLTVQQCANIKYDCDSRVDYDHCCNNLNGRITQCRFYQILNYEKEENNNICSKADSYIVIINLESSEVYNHIEMILNYIDNFGKKDMKIYFMGLYLDVDEIKCLNSKEDIKEYLEQQNIFYEYNEIDYNSPDDIASVISAITNDTLKNKIYDTLNLTKEIEKSNKARSCCLF